MLQQIGLKGTAIRLGLLVADDVLYGAGRSANVIRIGCRIKVTFVLLDP
jgi:hypothetical protein